MSEEKTRTDAWESCLTEEQQRSLYAWSRTPIDDGSDSPRRPTYEQAREYIASLEVKKVVVESRSRRKDDEDSALQLQLPTTTIPVPSRASWFRFLARQRKVDAIQQLCRIEAARDWGREVVSAAGMDPAELAAAFRAKAMDAMMDDDPKAVSAYAAAASALQDRAQKQQELALKERAQQTKDEQLKLAREKFEAAERRLQAVQDAVDAAKGGKLDPARVADEIDKILGRKKS